MNKDNEPIEQTEEEEQYEKHENENRELELTTSFHIKIKGREKELSIKCIQEKSKKPPLTYEEEYLVIDKKKVLATNRVFGITKSDTYVRGVSLLCLSCSKKKKNKKEIVKKLEFQCESDEKQQECIDILNQRIFKSKTINHQHLLVIVNPFSGQKKGVETFQSFCKPIFDLAPHITYHYIVSKNPEHPVELGRKINLEQYDGAVIVGGDGTISLFVQGLRKNKNPLAIKLPIGHIPCGSGNGLASSLGAFTPSEGALVITRGFTEKLDVISMFQDGKHNMVFLMSAWAVIADVDIGSEEFRQWGSLRFAIGALYYIMKKASYNATLKIITSSSFTSHSLNDKSKKYTSTLDSAYNYKDCYTEDDAKLSYPYINRFFKKELDVIAESTNDNEEDVTMTTPHIQESSIEVEQERSYQFPEDVKIETITMKFFLFLMSNTAMLASDFFGSPNQECASGTFDVLYAKSMSRTKLLGALNKMENGSILKEPAITKISTKAFYFEPEKEESFLSVDGESLPIHPFLMEVHPQYMNVYSWNKRGPKLPSVIPLESDL